MKVIQLILQHITQRKIMELKLDLKSFYLVVDIKKSAYLLQILKFSMQVMTRKKNYDTNATETFDREVEQSASGLVTDFLPENS